MMIPVSLRRSIQAIRDHRRPYKALEETRNRKPLRDNPLADWELRVGRFRVFYEVDAEERGCGLSP
jgi:hypothetical protein